VPISLLSLVGSAEVALARLSGRVPELTPGIAEIYDHEWRICSDKAVRDLGYRITPLGEGIAAMLAWLGATPGAAGAPDRSLSHAEPRAGGGRG
jgi:farnesol dehydrogenase